MIELCEQIPYQRAVMVHIKIPFLIVSLKIHVVNRILHVSLSFQIDFLLRVTFTSPEKQWSLSLTQVIMFKIISLQHLKALYKLELY